MMEEKRQRRLSEGSTDEPPSGAIEAVQRVQDQLEEINDRVATQILRIQSVANVERAPVYQSRRAAIASVPQFWKNAIFGHPWISNFVTERCTRVAARSTMRPSPLHALVRTGTAAFCRI